MPKQNSPKTDSSIGCMLAPFIVIILIIFLKDGWEEGIKTTGKMGSFMLQFLFGILFCCIFYYIIWKYFINRDKKD